MTGQRIEHEKAIELGRALSNSKELTRLRRAQAALQIDKEAYFIYRQLKTGRRITGKGTDITKAAEENTVIKELIDAQEDFNRLLKEINGIVGFYVTAQEMIEIGGRDCSGCEGCRH